MPFASAYRRFLTSDQAEVLETAAVSLLDTCLDDLTQLLAEPTADIAKTRITDLLPSKYLPRYTPQFAKQFVICLSTVIWKLAQPKRLPLACVAEEIAAYAVIEEAASVLASAGGTADFEGFIEFLFEDVDFLMLFEPEYDGVEHSELAQQIDIMHLTFNEWFLPFRPSTRVHPYALAGLSKAVRAHVAEDSVEWEVEDLEDWTEEEEGDIDVPGLDGEDEVDPGDEDPGDD